MYNKETNDPTQLSRDENKAVVELIFLLEESDQTDLIDCIDIEQLLQKCGGQASVAEPFKYTLEKKSDRFPPPSPNLNAVAFLKLL